MVAVLQLADSAISSICSRTTTSATTGEDCVGPVMVTSTSSAKISCRGPDAVASAVQRWLQCVRRTAQATESAPQGAFDSLDLLLSRHLYQKTDTIIFDRLYLAMRALTTISKNKDTNPTNPKVCVFACSGCAGTCDICTRSRRAI